MILPDQKFEEILTRICLPYITKCREGSSIESECREYVQHQMEYLDWHYSELDGVVFHKETLLGVLKLNPSLFNMAVREFNEYLRPLFYKMLNDLTKAISEVEALGRVPDFIIFCREHKLIFGGQKPSVVFGYDIKYPLEQIHEKSLVVSISGKYVVEVDSLETQGAIIVPHQTNP